MTTTLTFGNGSKLEVLRDGDLLRVSVAGREFEPVPVAGIRTAPLIFAGRVVVEAYRTGSNPFLHAPRSDVRTLAQHLREIL